MSVTCSCGASTCAVCCVENVARTPLPVSNRPGLPVIRRRVATHGTAKATMLHGFSRPDLPALLDLRTRLDDDFAVALVDAAAVAADVVSFYTDLLANESYLRTATEPRSLAEIARLVGYQVQPGLAATLDLAFTVATAPGTALLTTVPAGTAAQSTPDPGGQPVVFETLSEVVASPAWNTLRPRPRVPHPTQPDTTVSLAGVVSPLEAGDGVLYRSGSSFRFGLVTGATVVEAVGDLPGVPGRPARTDISLAAVTTVVSPAIADGPAAPRSATVPPSYAWTGASIDADDLASELAARSAAIEPMIAAFATTDAFPGEAWVFTAHGPLFGHQAPLATSMITVAVAEATARNAPPSAGVTSWLSGQALKVLPWDAGTVATLPVSGSGEAYLDGDVPVGVGTAVVLRDGDTWGAYVATAVSSEGVAAQAISGRATRVKLSTVAGLPAFSIRRTTAFTGPRRHLLADVPAPEALAQDEIELDGLYLGLVSGRRVVVSGTTVGDTGRTVTHSTTLSRVRHDLAHRVTTLTLGDYLPTPLRRDTVVIAGNVAPSSQGQTRHEVLGSGDGRLAFQQLALRQPPLTYLAEPSARGMSGTLTVWVDGVRWSEVDTLVTAGPDDRVYVLRRHEGSTVVEFGDGTTGARLPTGSANVTAVYRTGSGTEGRVRPGQVSLLMTRPAGLIGVWNPAPAVGGVDAEGTDSARASAPLRVQTIDRVVSIADYGAFARAFPGVAKAQAVWARAATHRGVLLTVAGEGGERVDPSTPTGYALLGALGQSGDPLVPVSLVSYRPRSFRLQALVRTDPRRSREQVLAAASAALRDRFSFLRRDLGQQVAASEVVEVVQSVAGVVAVTVTQLWAFTPGSASPAPSGPPPDVLAAASPEPGTDLAQLAASASDVVGAELLVLDAAPILWGVLP